jgi:hypothetical protein
LSVKKPMQTSVMTAMDYLEDQPRTIEQYSASPRPIDDAAFDGEPSEQRGTPAVFEHPTKTLYVLGLFLSIALITVWQLVRLPLGGVGSGLAGVALVAAGYIGFRLWLAQQSVSIDQTGFDLKMGNRSVRVPFQAIRAVQFDRLSHDLLVETENKTYRLARTLQGHRVIRLRLLATRPAQAANADDVLVVTARFLPKLGGTLALCVMAICVSLVMWLDAGLGMLNLLGMMLPTYVLFDRCIRRSYRLDHNGIQIRGIWKPRFHARGELVSATIRKATLSSTLRLQFDDEVVELDEYLLGHSLVEVSEYMESNWGTKIQPDGKPLGEYHRTATEAS